MLRHLTLGVLACCLALAALAQPDYNPPATGANLPRQPRAYMGGTSTLEVTPNGVFVLRNAVLAKFDTVGLKTAGTLELFGALAAQPKMSETPTDQERQAMRDWYSQMSKRMGTAVILPKDDMLYIVIGSMYFRVNQKTLALETKSDLAEPNAAPQGFFGQRETPVLKMDGGTLFVTSGQDLITVNPATGAVTGRATMPKEMFPNMGVMNPRAMGGMNGGQQPMQPRN